MVKDTDYGHCKHGPFVLGQGCGKCVAEARLERERLQGESEAPKHIVKVRYYSETTGELSAREYTYYSADPLKVGDTVIVPVRDTATCKAKVSAVDVPEAEIQAFRDKVKVIPAGSVVKPDPDFDIEEIPNELEAGLNQERSTITVVSDNLGETKTTVIPPEPITTALVAPETDLEVQSFYAEALKLLEYAKTRVITTVEEMKPATDDLTILAGLKKNMEAKRKELVSPLQEEVKRINAIFEKYSEPIKQADAITREKILAFRLKQDLIRKEQERINNLERETAEAKLKLTGEITEPALVEVAPIVAKTTHSDMGSAGMRDNWKWRLIDIKLVPAEYLMINVGVLTPIVKASKGKIPIPGIEQYNEPILAVSTR